MFFDGAFAIAGELQKFELCVLVVHAYFEMSDLFAELIELAFCVGGTHLVHVHLMDHFLPKV